MKKYAWLFCLLPLLFVRMASADEAKVAHQYIGVKKCKMCHMSQYKVWEGLKMAKALDTLKAENNTKTKKDETQNPECLKCHTTGFSEGGYEVGKTDPDLANVQCESCHGPGSDYFKMDIMKDKDKAKAAGLIIPDEKQCKTCHTLEQDPDFDFAKCSVEIDHKKKKE
ncbi:MAG: cytochrome C554 [Candidatus Omnitrophica bacterium]|nr:cytochrome C554 [Candidatus Omnitrophota bacterium]